MFYFSVSIRFWTLVANSANFIEQKKQEAGIKLYFIFIFLIQMSHDNSLCIYFILRPEYEKEGLQGLLKIIQEKNK